MVLGGRLVLSFLGKGRLSSKYETRGPLAAILAEERDGRDRAVVLRRRFFKGCLFSESKFADVVERDWRLSSSSSFCFCWRFWRRCASRSRDMGYRAVFGAPSLSFEGGACMESRDTGCTLTES